MERGHQDSEIRIGPNWPINRPAHRLAGYRRGVTPQLDGGSGMDTLDTKSLAGTVDGVNDALFFGRRIPKSESRQVAKWLATRQGLPGSYSGMFAPTARDFQAGIRLFTGERITSGAGTSHILGEEACRTLLLLKTDVKEAQQALQRAIRSMDRRLRGSESRGGRLGFF
jgi:hypothetical protein